MLDAAAGPSRAHRLRLLRAGDDPLRARELQGFRFRAAAHPGAACSYAMQEGALGGLSARPRARSGAAAGSSPAPCCCANGTGSRIRSGFSTMACSIRASAIAPCPRSPAGSPAPAGRGRASSASSHDDEDAGSALRRLHPQILRGGAGAGRVEEVLKTSTPRALRIAEIRKALQETGTEISFTSLRHALSQL